MLRVELSEKQIGRNTVLGFAMGVGAALIARPFVIVGSIVRSACGCGR